MTVTGPLEAREADAIGNTSSGTGAQSPGSRDGDTDRRAYLVADLPDDLAEMLRTKKTPEDLPDYPYDEPGIPLPA